MLILDFSNYLDINVYVGKLSEQHFKVWLLFNPGDKILFLWKFYEVRISEWNLSVLPSKIRHGDFLRPSVLRHTCTTPMASEFFLGFMHFYRFLDFFWIFLGGFFFDIFRKFHIFLKKKLFSYLYLRISVCPLSVTLRLPPLDSETGGLESSGRILSS